MTTKIVSMFGSSLAAFILGLLLSPQLMVPTGDLQRADAAFSDKGEHTGARPGRVLYGPGRK